jgi:hypothetical protein
MAAVATTAARTTSTTTGPAAAPTTTATAGGALLSLVHPQRASAHRVPIQVLDSAGSVCIAHLDKSKPSRTARVTIHDDIHGFNGAVLRKQSSHLRFVCTEREITNVDFCHCHCSRKHC